MKKLFLLLSSIVYIILLVGCGSTEYDKLIDKPDEFIKTEKYAEAHDNLKSALGEKENGRPSLD